MSRRLGTVAGGTLLSVYLTILPGCAQVFAGAQLGVVVFASAGRAL